MPVTNPVRNWLNRKIRHHVDEAIAPLLPRLGDLSGQIEEVRRVTVEVQRLVTDDLDASNEAAALLGRAIAELQAAVEDLRGEQHDVTAD